MRVSLENETQIPYGEEVKVDLINSFGGEWWDGDFEISEYGFQLGDLTVGKLTPEQYKILAIQMINHLGTNGHRFELGFHQDGQFIQAI